jgi:hypothetical protein
MMGFSETKGRRDLGGERRGEEGGRELELPRADSQ